MARRRVSEVSLNFDSLTDLVTNLAGGLIMMVLLLYGMTRGTAIQARSAASTMRPDPTAPAQSASPHDVALQAEVAALQQALQQLEDELRKNQAEAEELRKAAYASQPRAAVDPKAKAGQPALIQFRPPMLMDTEKTTGTVFVLTKGKVFHLDVAEFSGSYTQARKELKNALDNNLDVKSYESGLLKRFRRGDFDARFTISNLKKTPEGYSGMFKATLVLKPNSQGESVEQAQETKSNYRTQLDQLDPDRHVIGFFVYPDCFELFRTVRAFIFERKFNYNWAPMAAEEELNLGPGGGIAF